MLIFLSTTGEILSRNFRTIASTLLCTKKRKPKTATKTKKNRNETTYLNTSFGHKGSNNIADGQVPYGVNEDLPHVKKRRNAGYAGDLTCEHEPPGKAAIFLSFVVVILYMCSGAYLFQYVESWSYLEGTFFCFTSLTTIGFGEMVPGLRHNMSLGSKKASQSEIISVLTTSCFIFIGMALIAMSFHLVQDEIVLIMKRLTKFFGVVEEPTGEKEEIEGISMSIVSSTAS